MATRNIQQGGQQGTTEQAGRQPGNAGLRQDRLQEQAAASDRDIQDTRGGARDASGGVGTQRAGNAGQQRDAKGRFAEKDRNR